MFPTQQNPSDPELPKPASMGWAFSMRTRRLTSSGRGAAGGGRGGSDDGWGGGGCARWLLESWASSKGGMNHAISLVLSQCEVISKKKLIFKSILERMGAMDIP